MWQCGMVWHGTLQCGMVWHVEVEEVGARLARFGFGWILLVITNVVIRNIL